MVKDNMCSLVWFSSFIWRHLTFPTTLKTVIKPKSSLSTLQVGRRIQYLVHFTFSTPPTCVWYAFKCKLEPLLLSPVKLLDGIESWFCSLLFDRRGWWGGGGDMRRQNLSPDQQWSISHYTTLWNGTSKLCNANIL